MIQVQFSIFQVIILLCIWQNSHCYEIISFYNTTEMICDENEHEPLNKSHINETIFSYPSFMKIYKCPPPKKPYLEALKQISIDAFRVIEIWFIDTADIEELTGSLLHGMPLRKAVFVSKATQYVVSSKFTGKLDLTNGETYLHACPRDEDLLPLNMKAMLPNGILTVRAVEFYDCPPPSVSYLDVFQKININPTSVKQLVLKIRTESLQFEPGHFQGLLLNALKVDNNNNELDPKIFEEVAVDEVTLFQVKLKTLPKWRIKKAELKDGKFVGEWGDCSMLTSLRLTDFSVPEVPGGWLSDCRNLTELTLRRLGRKAVDQTLMGARALNTLTIEDCNIDFLTTAFAPDAVNLRVLKIKDKLMTSITVAAFSAFRKLEELDLAGNKFLNALKIFRAITPLGQLRKLTIDMNPVYEFCGDFGRHKVEMKSAPPPYNNFMPGVERLYLRHTLFSYICFQDWHNLTYLDLRDNMISDLQLEGLPAPRQHPLTVDLRKNPLWILPSTATVDIEKFKGSQNITLLLVETVVDFDCEYSSLVKALHELPQISMQNVTCTSGVRFVDFHGDRFNCYKYPCGNCTCRTSWRDGATVADCGPGGLYTFPEVWSALKESSELQGEVFLKKILASNNFIEKLPEIKYPESLIEVDLSNNKIDRISRSALDALFSGGKRRVRLSGNPFVCECDTQDMLDAFSRNQNQIPDYKNLTCANQKSSLHELQGRSLCTERALVAIGIVSVSLLALAAITAFIYVRYKLTIKAFLYARGLCLSCVREEELDADREYDAFVSYAHPDDEFVADALLPGLENDYKLCVHTRNWMLGEMIHTQIIESVQKSRRTIIVLSKSFVGSTWGMTEFRTAYSNSLREGRVRVICIVVDDVIDDANLNSELKSYLKSNTYLKFDDPWFWQKLRYAMPHPRVTGDQSGARNQNQSVQEN